MHTIESTSSAGVSHKGCRPWAALVLASTGMRRPNFAQTAWEKQWRSLKRRSAGTLPWQADQRILHVADVEADVTGDDGDHGSSRKNAQPKPRGESVVTGNNPIDDLAGGDGPMPCEPIPGSARERGGNCGREEGNTDDGREAAPGRMGQHADGEADKRSNGQITRRTKERARRRDPRSRPKGGRRRQSCVIVPVLGLISPSNMRSVVLLPAPLGRRKPVTTPGLAVKLSSSTTTILHCWEGVVISRPRA